MVMQGGRTWTSSGLSTCWKIFFLLFKASRTRAMELNQPDKFCNIVFKCVVGDRVKIILRNHKCLVGFHRS